MRGWRQSVCVRAVNRAPVVSFAHMIGGKNSSLFSLAHKRRYDGPSVLSSGVVLSYMPARQSSRDAQSTIFTPYPAVSRPTLTYYPSERSSELLEHKFRPLAAGMGEAVAKRTILRKKQDGKFETWADVAKRVALGNVLLSKNSAGESDPGICSTV